MAGNGKPLQFRGLCPLLLRPSERSPNAEVTWPWDGAGVEPMSDEPDDQITVTARSNGARPLAQVERRGFSKEQTPRRRFRRRASTQVTGLLVGIEYGADMPGQAGLSTVMPSSRPQRRSLQDGAQTDRPDGQLPVTLHCSSASGW